MGREEIRSTPAMNFADLVQAAVRIRTCDEVSWQSKFTKTNSTHLVLSSVQEVASRPAHRCCVDSASAQEPSSRIRRTMEAGARILSGLAPKKRNRSAVRAISIALATRKLLRPSRRRRRTSSVDLGRNAIKEGERSSHAEFVQDVFGLGLFGGAFQRTLPQVEDHPCGQYKRHGDTVFARAHGAYLHHHATVEAPLEGPSSLQRH